MAEPTGIAEALSDRYMLERELGQGGLGTTPAAPAPNPAPPRTSGW